MSPLKKKYDILILEDELEIAQIIKTYLKLYPAFNNVVFAENSMQATQKLSNQKFDLIITDIQLDKRNAMEFIEKLRKQPKYFQQKIMVVSGCLTKDITLKLMRSNVKYVLVKPFTARQILINALRCLDIERKPQATVDNIIMKVKERFSKEKTKFANSIPDAELAEMIKVSKGKKK